VVSKEVTAGASAHAALGCYANEIWKDISEGQKTGVRRTPTFCIGVSEEEDTKIKALKVIRGAKPYIEFKEALESLLSRK